MSLMVLPEQLRFKMEEEEDDAAHSLRADPDSTQSDPIIHTDLSEDCFLPPIETAKPQSNSLQAAAAFFRVQSE